MPDAFRRGLGYAIQWYDNLRTHLSKCVDMAVLTADAHVQDLNRSQDLTVPTAHEVPSSEGSSGLMQGECAHILIERCPACFGGIWFGRPLNE
jgi:hypothetical protein